MPTDYEREVLREFLATHQSPKEKAAQEDQPRIWGDSGSKRIAELEAQVAALQAERDSEERWADQYSKQVDALKAELLASTSQVTRLTQECNRLDAELKAARAALVEIHKFEYFYENSNGVACFHFHSADLSEETVDAIAAALSAARARRQNEGE